MPYGNFKELEPKTSQAWMSEALEALDDMSNKFAIFVDHFRKTLETFIKENAKTG